MKKKHKNKKTFPPSPVASTILAAILYVAFMHKAVYSKLGNSICELLFGIKGRN